MYIGEADILHDTSWPQIPIGDPGLLKGPSSGFGQLLTALPLHVRQLWFDSFQLSLFWTAPLSLRALSNYLI